MDLGSVPKVELHRHLEGSIRLSTIIELSNEAGIDLPAHTPEALAPHALIREPVASLEEALSRFGIAQRSIHSLEAVRRIAREAVEDLAADNVRLAELRFSPEFMCEPASLDWDEAMDAVAEGTAQAASDLDVAVGLVAIFSRDYGMESADRTVAFALRHRDRLVGFDIAGNEVGYPPTIYATPLRPLRDAGMHLTAHYGESGPPHFVREAIEALGAERIGHGLSATWDEGVTALVVDRGVTLEMCPTSNVLTRGVARPQDHPARRLLHRGVRVTINTDDPGLMGIDLTHEWAVARDALGFNEEDFRKVTANAVAACFLPDEVKTDVSRRHFGWLDG